ncbi:MAG: glycosyltransferase [Alphaproteobacteria bacterium]
MREKRLLVVTLPPLEGGVPAKTRILVEFLIRRGWSVTVAHYATLSDYPDLVAPSWRIPSGARPRLRHGTCFDGVPSVAVGCWLPEVEATYYRPSRLWDEAIAGHDRHIAVGGTVLASYPLLKAGIAHLIWCASPMIDDRIDRRAGMSAPRRLFDRLVVAPLQARMEREILAGPGLVMPVSAYAARGLAALGRDPARIRPVPIPVDVVAYQPPPEPPEPGVIGFAGRIGDPRKNVALLIEAVALAVRSGADLRLEMTGTPDATTSRLVTERGLGERVRFHGHVPRESLPDFYRRLDVFAIPSRQEGFGIVGIEAMACGVPVVSTRCGGPDDYVMPDETGYLVPHEPMPMAERIMAIVADRPLRDRLSAAARALAVARYGHARFEEAVSAAWSDVWGDAP